MTFEASVELVGSGQSPVPVPVTRSDATASVGELALGAPRQEVASYELSLPTPAADDYALHLAVVGKDRRTRIGSTAALACVRAGPAAARASEVAAGLRGDHDGSEGSEVLGLHGSSFSRLVAGRRLRATSLPRRSRRPPACRPGCGAHLLVPRVSRARSHHASSTAREEEEEEEEEGEEVSPVALTMAGRLRTFPRR